MRKLRLGLGVGLALVAAAGLLVSSAIGQGAGANGFGAAAVNHQRQLNADKEPGTWMSAGRTYDEQRYSPLTQINKANIKDLGLAWYGDIDTERGQESTPVVVDGMLYVTSAWSKLFAYNAKTGELIWKYDPKVDTAFGQVACCDVVNRGVAAWNGKIYLGALDGRLIALDSKTGKEVWTVQTTDPKLPYTITQVPRIAKGAVIIGNAGAEYSIRGYVSAYDLETGKLKWRFYTVPGNPKDGFDNQPELKKAAETWSGEWWKFGGGGTAWDSILYDPKTNLVYFGTGNGLSWSRTIRDPKGGDNLFVASIVAVNADTGKYAWHYQSVPGDEWDYDVTNPLMTADLVIGGKKRHVLMQAPKTAFFYVWDAKTGKLISAEKFGPANWASRIDPKTGPVVNPDVRYTVTKAAIVQPAPLGAHNWHPMSFSPRTGLVYIPVTESVTAFQSADPAKFTMKERAYNTGTISASPEITALFNQPGALKRGNISSWLAAYDPVSAKVVWKAKPNAVYGASGTMVTASDLVFMGNHSGEFSAYDARTGDKVWSIKVDAKVVAAPSTYVIDGEQYVALLVGARGLPEGVVRTSAVSQNNSRILVFKLGANAKLPTREFKASTTTLAKLDPPLLTGTNEQVIDGQGAYGKYCSGCHGANAVADKTAPDLRLTTLLRSKADWDAVVLGGSRAAGGMASFKAILADGDSENILHYVVSRANQDKAAEQAKAAPVANR
jgi:quinohemoprotein ethanol dehydrogenase